MHSTGLDSKSYSMMCRRFRGIEKTQSNDTNHLKH